MPFEYNLPLNDINPDWTEKRYGYRKMEEFSIRVVPIVSSYGDESTNSNSLSISINLSPTPEIKITKSVNTSWEEVAEKEFKK